MLFYQFQMLPSYTYGENKVGIEGIIFSLEENPDILSVSVIRPCGVAPSLFIGTGNLSTVEVQQIVTGKLKERGYEATDYLLMDPEIKSV